MKTIYLLFLLSFFNLNAQQHIKVSYSEYMNIHIPIKQTNQLYIDLENNKTVWVENVSNQIRDYDKINEEQKKKEEELIKNSNHAEVSLQRAIPNDYIIHNYKDKEVELIEDLGKKIFNVKDNFIEKNWVLHKESKMINDIECFKASTSFRGNEWEVWYAPSLPYPYGPWKLNGLPGLILEAKSTDGFYTMIADKIENNYPDNEPVIPIDKILKELSLKEYLEYHDTIYNLLFLGEDMASRAQDAFAYRKEKKFEIKANLSWED